MKISMPRILTSVVLAASCLVTSSAFALEVGQKAPCVVLDDVQTDGSVVNHCIRTKAPKTTFVMLEFFSITCEYCQANLPKVAELSGQINGTTTVRLVSIDRNADAIRAYLNENRSNILFPVSFDTDRDAKKAYDITAVPTVYILDKSNTVVYKHVGEFADEDLAAIRELVK